MIDSKAGVRQSSLSIHVKAVVLRADRFESKFASIATSDDEIRNHAYQLYELRGRADGRALEDWLTAERHLDLRARKNRANKVIFR